MKILSSAAEFHDFEAVKRVVGRFVEPVIADADSTILQNGVPKWLKGDLLGYMLEDENGARYLVGSQIMIKKAVEKSGVGHVLGITYLGKTTTASGQPLARYEVIEFDGDKFEGDNKEFKEALAYYGTNENKGF